MYLYKPFLEWNNGADTLDPGSAREDYKDNRGTERYRHISASGQAMTYYVGARRLLQNTFRWLDEDTVDDLKDFFDDVKDGAEFVYHTDDSINRVGLDVTCGDGSLCGDTASGTADVATTVTLEQDELTFEDESTYGFSMTTLYMREVV